MFKTARSPKSKILAFAFRPFSIRISNRHYRNVSRARLETGDRRSLVFFENRQNRREFTVEKHDDIRRADFPMRVLKRFDNCSHAWTEFGVSRYFFDFDNVFFKGKQLFVDNCIGKFGSDGHYIASRFNRRRFNHGFGIVFFIAAANFFLALAHAGLRQHFKPNVFDDVIKMRAFVQPLDKSAGFSQSAVMPAEFRQRFEQPSVKARNFVRLASFQIFKVKPHYDNRLMAVNVCAVQGFDRFDFHIIFLFLL
jgi:hypothetical protein